MFSGEDSQHFINIYNLQFHNLFTLTKKILNTLPFGMGYGQIALLRWSEWEVYQIKKRDIWVSRKQIQGHGDFILNTGQSRENGNPSSTVL